MLAAFNLVGARVPASSWYISVELHNGPFRISTYDKLLAGLSYSEDGMTVINNIYFPCLFDPQSALLHEFVHMALFIKTGNEDNTHANPVWDEVDGRRANLERRHCRVPAEAAR